MVPHMLLGVVDIRSWQFYFAAPSSLSNCRFFVLFWPKLTGCNSSSCTFEFDFRDFYICRKPLPLGLWDKQKQKPEQTSFPVKISHIFRKSYVLSYMYLRLSTDHKLSGKHVQGSILSINKALLHVTAVINDVSIWLWLPGGCYSEKTLLTYHLQSLL